MSFWSKITSGLTTIANPVTSLAKMISKPIETWQKQKGEKQAAQHAVDMAALEFKSQLILNKESHNQTWEIESLRQPQKKNMQWLTLLIILIPFIVAWFNPALVSTYFATAISAIPLWYQQMTVTVIGVIWGSTQIKNIAKDLGDVYKQSKIVNIDKVLDSKAKDIIRAKDKYEIFDKK